MDFWISVWISADSVRDFFRDGPLGNLTVSRGRAHFADIAQYCLTPRTHFLVAGVIKEVVSWL